MIDFNFIQQLEGFETSGYVPKPDGGPIESGVTIASGFDLGQLSVDEIDDNFELELADKLAHYCSVTGFEAVELIKMKPLTLSTSECLTINEYAHKQAVSLLLSDWGRCAPTPFGSIHPAIQTVIASVAFQYGDLPTRTPNFWFQAINRDYKGMIKNLRSFGDRFNTRRNKEADYMLSAINLYREFD